MCVRDLLWEGICVCSCQDGESAQAQLCAGSELGFG